MTMIHFAPKQSQNGVLCPFTSKFQTSTIGYYGGELLSSVPKWDLGVSFWD